MSRIIRCDDTQALAEANENHEFVVQIDHVCETPLAHMFEMVEEGTG